MSILSLELANITATAAIQTLFRRRADTGVVDGELIRMISDDETISS